MPNDRQQSSSTSEARPLSDAELSPDEGLEILQRAREKAGKPFRLLQFVGTADLCRVGTIGLQERCETLGGDVIKAETIVVGPTRIIANGTCADVLVTFARNRVCSTYTCSSTCPSRFAVGKKSIDSWLWRRDRPRASPAASKSMMHDPIRIAFCRLRLALSERPPRQDDDVADPNRFGDPLQRVRCHAELHNEVSHDRIRKQSRSRSVEFRFPIRAGAPAYINRSPLILRDACDGVDKDRMVRLGHQRPLADL